MKAAAQMPGAREHAKSTTDEIVRQIDRKHLEEMTSSTENSRKLDHIQLMPRNAPSETEQSTDTDGDGAEADDENEESEPKKGNKVY